MPDFTKTLSTLQQKGTLSQTQAYALQKRILAGDIDTPQLVKIFESLAERLAEPEELVGFLQASRESMNRVELDFPTLDTCSTGGDGINIFNVSTLSAIVCASLKVPVAKHGNKSASSSHGSFDLLENLGLNFQLNPQQAQTVIRQTGLVFLFAPLFHPAFRFAKSARLQFGQPTYFNFLGPLLNPTQSQYQVIGVSNTQMVPAMGQALIQSGSKRVWLVQGQDGLNEISPTGLTKVWEFREDQANPEEFWLNPQEYGLPLHSLADIQCNDPHQAKKIFWDALDNRASQAVQDTVILNSAAGLYVYGKINNYLDGVNLAREAIQSGLAKQKWEEFVSVVNGG